MQLERLILHRGASTYAPENTLAAFDKALEYGSRAIEFDVMMSADGGLFVFHDIKLSRTSNGRGKLAEASNDYIMSLDAGSWFSKRFKGEKIPSLADALQWCAAYKMQVNIEIKPAPGQVEAITTAVLACLNRYWPSDLPLPLVSCFDSVALHLCATLAPELPLGVLFFEWDKAWLKKVQDVHGVAVYLSKGWVSRNRLQAIKQEGYLACVYTVNSRRQASRFFAWGADSICTDYPDLMDGHESVEKI
jgi:glycerophosphoryl diester phosphodiesterase